MNEIPSILNPAPQGRRLRNSLLVLGPTILVLAGALALWLHFRPHKVVGRVSLPEASFSLRDGCATWQPDTGWLILYLSPNPLPRHKETIQQADASSVPSPGLPSLVRRTGGSVEMTIIFGSDHHKGRQIDTISFAVSSPSKPDASRIFMQGRVNAPWIQAIAMSNSTDGGFVSLCSTGTCTDESGPVSWSLNVSKMPLEIER